ncbi:MAG TPA: TonB-dependent receptor [Rhizomicrobium sp.]|jgi:iron complex outermembrane receptor protein|nr:TonB-dependent receptor [Rhizomicrobium sp.]
MSHISMHSHSGLRGPASALRFLKSASSAAALAAAISLAAAGGARAQAASDNIETVVVTGSRVISDAAKAPTPLTIISAAEIQATTPTNIPDGLNKLPIFQGSVGIGRAGDGTGGFGAAGVQGGNLATNVLNLRNFGSQRTLVLLDGHRAPPGNSDGTVDIDTLPQMLISRVDIVTGGASAVYGSDAVTGVVNFVLDKNFNGLKIDTNAGISNYADAASYKFGLAAGSELFGGRGHVEGSLEYRHRDGFLGFSRPFGPGLAAQVGSGTAANPFAFIPNGRRPNSTFGGLIGGCSPACPAATGMQFIANGVLAPFVPGTPGAFNAAGAPTAGTSNENSGGDGAYSPFTTAQAAYRQGTAFTRFSYNLDDSTVFYVQAAASEAYTTGWHFPQKLTPGAGQADIFYKNNPFLPASVQTALGNNGTNVPQNPALSPAVAPANSFQLGEFLVGLGQSTTNGDTNVDRLLSVQAGLDGALMGGRFAWNLFYTHGENRLADDLINNQNYQKLYAASDAVLNANGTAQCYAATQAATAAAYANCVPINPFGPTALTRNAFNYFAENTAFHQTNILDNVGGGISGTVFDGWAGPITAALSSEARFNDFTVTTNVPPNQTVDCTGLRICSSLLPKYAQGVLVPFHASNNVWEVAGEAEVPLLKDLPLVRSLDVNLAGRYTDYSTSGAVQTWKLGFVYNVIDQLRFRGTTSIDIRAPTLNDLFQPPVTSVIGFTDNHTSFNSTTFSVTSGNSALTPEIARNYTIGTVWTPDFISGLTMSLDYFRIHMKNAISLINPQTSSIQSLCENSGGTSPFCALYLRPFPFSNTSQANYPTRIFTQELNTASVQTEGFDFETNYGFQMSDLVNDWAGSWKVRALASYQPVNESVQFPAAPFTRLTSPHTRLTAFLNYSLDDWTFGLEDRWVSGFSQVSGQITATTNNWVQPYVHSFNDVDLNIERNFQAGGIDMTGYFVVQNLVNALPALVPSVTNIGLNYPVAPGQDITGRYFTIGVRANL